MKRSVLITGGAGFIGQHLARELLSLGHYIRIYDNFNPQVHQTKSIAADLINKVDLIEGDINDSDLLYKSLDGINSVVHLAAETGTGQSMYEIETYFKTNVQGTANLVNLMQKKVIEGIYFDSFVVASSRSVYGEGLYECRNHGPQQPSQRGNTSFDPLCVFCHEPMHHLPTKETSQLIPLSIYGLTKKIQEELVVFFGNNQKINTFALRLQNVYGEGQSLVNPYTGILAIFSNLAKDNKTIEVYEDGKESRDFIYVKDVVQAFIQAISYEGKFCGALNVGSGHSTSVIDVAEQIKQYFKSKSNIEITGRYRLGDIRHNKADLEYTKKILNFSPKEEFKNGLSKFLLWASSEKIKQNNSYSETVKELESYNLIKTLEINE
jgi:dTDP-L-rhamnose 4-epimerase